jgi:hypothetical protein
MIIIKRKILKIVIILFLIPILLWAAIHGISAAEEKLYRHNFPDPKDLPDNWVYPIIPAFSIPEKGCALYVDLDICQMTVYMDGKVYKTYPVSGGSRSTPSPLGTWKVVGKDNWNEGFGGSWIALNVPWGKYGIHGTVMPWAVGQNVSKGCIRLKNSDVAEVKRLVKWGTLVHIKYDSIPFRAMKDGMIGSDVLNAQSMLKDLGYYKGGLDGKFGTGLRQAVKAFQKANRMYADGVIGKQTYNKLHELTQ